MYLYSDELTQQTNTIDGNRELSGPKTHRNSDIDSQFKRIIIYESQPKEKKHGIFIKPL